MNNAVHLNALYCASNDGSTAWLEVSRHTRRPRETQYGQNCQCWSKKYEELANMAGSDPSGMGV